MTAQRFRYLDLTIDQRHEVDAWCEAHEIVLKDTPVDAKLAYDPDTDERVVEQWALRDGRKYLDDDGLALVRVTVRRKHVADPHPSWLQPEQAERA